MQDFTKLRVWHEAHAFAVAIDRALATAVKGRADLTNQLRRAAESIPANIAEGAGQVTDPQFARFLAVALGSTTESTNHLMLARDTRVLASATAADLLAHAGRIRGMLINLLKRVNT
ncbi:four helix bundle protein [Gemmatimonas sp.]|uniref:four helix bundle protein n=1 Tax=Gemmatimonas sp. TaxID=1962908 RepID=UPI00398390EE